MPRIWTVAALATAAFVLLAAGAAYAASPLGTNLGPSKNGTASNLSRAITTATRTATSSPTSRARSQASALHVNYSAALGSVKGAPRQFFILGKAAPGQLSVLGSEPGETSYNPLWEEIMVTWKPGVTPVLLVKDDQIDALAKKGELTGARTRTSC